MEKTTITISKNMARRLRLWKAQLDVKTIEDVFDKILCIVPASELQGLKSPNNQKGVVLS